MSWLYELYLRANKGGAYSPWIVGKLTKVIWVIIGMVLPITKFTVAIKAL